MYAYVDDDADIKVEEGEIEVYGWSKVMLDYGVYVKIYIYDSFIVSYICNYVYIYVLFSNYVYILIAYEYFPIYTKHSPNIT